MRDAALVLARFALVAIAVLALRQYCYLPFQCTHTIVIVARRTHLALDRQSSIEAKRTARRNLEMLDSVAGGCRTDLDPYLLRAFNDKILGRTDAALRDLDDGLRVDDRPEIYFDRGLMLLDVGRMDAGVKDLAIAARFNPTLLDQLQGDLRQRVAGLLSTAESAREVR